MKVIKIEHSNNHKTNLVDALREAIIEGHFEPGMPLRQEEIAEQYSVSRMPVREAFRELETIGLLQVIPNKGAFVAPLDHAEFRENFEMRAAAECLALKVAIPELNNRQLEEAVVIHKQMLVCNQREYGALNNQFHTRLYSPCRRPRLLDHITTLNILAERYMLLTIGHFDYSTRSNDEHSKLIAACAGRDVDEAVMLLYSHITSAGEHLEEVFFKVRDP